MRGLRDLLAARDMSGFSRRLALGAVVLSCLVLRLYSISTPGIDRTRWKEVDYIHISTEYWRTGYDFLHPNISWPVGPSSISAMEFPLVPFLASLSYPVLGGVHAFSVRWVSLLAFLGIVVVVFKLVEREIGHRAAVAAAMAAALLPLFNRFGNALFSEPTMILFCALAVLEFRSWVELGGRRHWWGTVGALSLAWALKPTSMVILLPLAWLYLRDRTTREVRPLRNVATLLGLALVLPVTWYAWTYHLTHAYGDVFGIFGGHDKFQTLTMLSDPSWYRAMAGCVGSRILGGPIGIAVAAIGLYTMFRLRLGGLFFAYLGGIVAFFVIVAEGQIDGPYRQLTIVPPLSVAVGIGLLGIGHFVAAVYTRLRRGDVADRQRRIVTWIAATLVLLAMLLGRVDRTLAHDASASFHPGHWKEAQRVKRFVQPGDRVITAGHYTIHKGGNDLSPLFYYYTQTKGWSLQSGDWRMSHVQDLIGKGATFFYAANMDREPESLPFVREMRGRYPTLIDEESWMLLDLRGE